MDKLLDGCFVRGATPARYIPAPARPKPRKPPKPRRKAPPPPLVTALNLVAPDPSYAATPRGKTGGPSVPSRVLRGLALEWRGPTCAHLARHFRVVCDRCGTIVRQCRCRGALRRIRAGRCLECTALHGPRGNV